MDFEFEEREIERLYDAIMAQDRKEALLRFGNLFPHHHNRSVAEQRNLFPDRIPA